MVVGTGPAIALGLANRTAGRQIDIGCKPLIFQASRRAVAANVASIATQVTKSRGRRNRLRRVHARAVASVIAEGSARSNASALGMKSNADHSRIAAWLPRAASSQVRTAGYGHPTIKETM